MCAMKGVVLFKVMVKNHILLFFLLCVAPFVQSQRIEISGNGTNIAVDGSNIPSSADFTKYINILVGNSESHDFLIKNIERKSIS